jgi:hypothetical protein
MLMQRRRPGLDPHPADRGLPLSGGSSSSRRRRPARSSLAARELLLADVGQTLAKFGDQRIVIGQGLLQAVDRVAK